MIYILTAIHNNLPHVKKFIDCLNKQTYRNAMLLIVDAGSIDGGAEYAMHNSKIPVTTVWATDKDYWGDCLQLGYERLKILGRNRDNVLIVNVDVEFGEDYLDIGISHIRSKTLIVTSGYDQKTLEHISGGLHVDWSKFSFEVSDDINICGTTGLFLSMTDLLESDGFSRWLSHHFCDTEFTWRLTKRGFVIEAPDDLVFFMDSENTGIAYPRNLREVFDKRCSQNPLSKSMFILLCCPIKYWFINLLRAWYWLIRRNP